MMRLLGLSYAEKNFGDGILGAVVQHVTASDDLPELDPPSGAYPSSAEARLGRSARLDSTTSKPDRLFAKCGKAIGSLTTFISAKITKKAFPTDCQTLPDAIGRVTFGGRTGNPSAVSLS
jgi:hypothetical protein